MDVITPEEFENRMKEIREYRYYECDDEELCHRVMDDLMCEVLTQLGYKAGVDVFEDTPKLYA